MSKYDCSKCLDFVHEQERMCNDIEQEESCNGCGSQYGRRSARRGRAFEGDDLI